MEDLINNKYRSLFPQLNFDCEDSNMVKLNFDKLKTQVKNSFIEEWNELGFIEIASPVVMLFWGSLLWMTGQSWIYFVLGVMIFAFLFAKLKNKKKTGKKVQEPPVLVLEKTKRNEYELFLKKASRGRPETDKLTFTIGDLLRSRDPQWLNHAISTVWRHLRRPSEDVFCES